MRNTSCTIVLMGAASAFVSGCIIRDVHEDPVAECAVPGNCRSTTPPPTGPWTVHAGGYVTSGPLHGYAWTYADPGSTISPANFSGVAANAKLCVSGTVGPKTDSSGIAILGFNLNQAEGVNTAENAWAPTGTGFTFSVTNDPGSSLRAQIQTPAGKTDPNARWCAPLTGGGGAFPWSSFKTNCWEGTGTAYAKQPISQVQVTVPGGNSTPVQFAFCLNSVAPY